MNPRNVVDGKTFILDTRRAVLAAPIIALQPRLDLCQLSGQFGIGRGWHFYGRTQQVDLPARADVITDGGYPEKIIANAPETFDHYFVVPKVIE